MKTNNIDLNNNRLSKIGIAIILSLVAYFTSNIIFTDTQAKLIGVLTFLVTLWTNEGLPLGAVSLLPILLFPSLDIASTNVVSSNYSKSIVFLFLGGFLLAIAVEKINLHKKIAEKILSIFPASPRGMIYSLAFTSAILSSVLSNTTTALLLMPIGLCLTDDTKLKVRFVLSIAYGASIGGITTPIGTPPNLILLGFLTDNNLEKISFVKWIIMTAPLAGVMLLIVPYVLSLRIQQTVICVNFNSEPNLTPEQKRLIFILLSLIVMLLLNSNFGSFYSGLGINEKGLILGFGLMMFLPKIGFLKWEDTKRIPYEIIFLFGAGFSIAAAFMKTGLASEISSIIVKADITSLSLIFILLFATTFIVFMTEVTSNTALISIILPIIYSLGKTTSVNTPLLLIASTICASYAFMLPIATPPNAIAMSSNVLKIKDMAGFGFIFNIIAIILTTLIAVVYWKHIL